MGEQVALLVILLVVSEVVLQVMDVAMAKVAQEEDTLEGEQVQQALPMEEREVHIIQGLIKATMLEIQEQQF
jgi:hypothetical protein